MIPANKIGKTRMELAEILTKFCRTHVPPALLIKNTEDYRSSRNYGYAFSWFVDVGASHPLYAHGSTITMVDFVRHCKAGYRVEKSKEELFIVLPQH